MSFQKWLLTCIAFYAFSTSAQQFSGNYKAGFKRDSNRFSFVNSNSRVAIDFCTAGMFRVRSVNNEALAADEPWMVVQYNWSPVQVTAKESPGYFTLTTAVISIKIMKSPFRVEVYDPKGKLLSADAAGAFTGTDTAGCIKKLSPGEHFFGFGERMDFLDRRGKKVALDVGRGKGRPHIIGAYNILEANYSPVPFFMSTKGYGIFFHTAYPTFWDMGAANNDQYSFSASGGQLDYYFMYGPKFPAILQQYTALTGRSPLVPKFALGLHVGTYSGGTWGYEQFTSDRYVIELARKLREMGVPVDILWLDSTWRIFGDTGGKGATSFEWRETFKDPKGMFDSLYAMKYHMAGLHLRPRFDNGKKLKLLDTARKLGYTYPEESRPGEFVNYFDSNSVNWWWEHGVMRVASQGAMFLKTDEGSAFGALANESDKTGPRGKEIKKLHNLFPIAYAKAPYGKFQQYNGIRGLNQTREGYAGIQRYPFIFAGDWPSEWQYFPAVIKAGLNIGLSGVGYWAHCMGGFEHPADPELYIRWCQFGMLSSMAMVFGMDHPGYKEPWNYGEDGLRNFIKYDSLRYALMPYLYSHAWQMYRTGMPLMRALVLDYQDDVNVYNVEDQYMLGNSLMVCPVTTKGAQTRTVYLPKGRWIDFWTNKWYEGGQYIHVVTPLDTMPMFVKAGSIIPQQEHMRYTGEKPVGLVTLDVYPGNTNDTFSLYEDDEKSLDYQQGKYAVTKMFTKNQPNGWEIHIQKPAGNFDAPVHRYMLRIHTATPVKKVAVNGKPVTPVVNETAGGEILLVNTPGSGETPVSVSVEWR